MAEKYWWQKEEQPSSSQQSANQNTSSQGYWWQRENLGSTIGNNITNRVNTWLQDHNSYVSNYQKRNAGRKYSYEDSYVKDSGSWLDTVSKQKSAFDEEADSILAYLDQYKGFLDAEWVKSVKDTLTSARSQQSLILENSTKDNEWWSSFADETEYKTAQRYDGYSKKYSGQKYDDIQKALSTLEDGSEEKLWLGQAQYDLYKKDRTYQSKAMSGLKSFEAQKVADHEQKANKTWADFVIDTFTATDNPMLDSIMDTRKLYEEDTSWREMNDKWSEGQRRQFGYLYAEDPEKAYKYAEQVNNQINALEKYEQQQAIGTAASQNIGIGTLGAIASAPMGMGDFLDDLIEYSARGTITQKDYLSPFEMGQAAQSGIANHLNKKYGTIGEDTWVLGGKGWGDVYSLGVSAANSLVSAYTMGGAGTLVNFIGQGGAAGVDDALSRGASAEQALLYGSIVGAAEGLTEMINADNLLKIGSSATLKNYLLKALNQGIGESIEEGSSSIIGNIADRIIMQDKSNFNATVKSYMDNGMSEEEAKKKAWVDMVGDVVFDAMGGFATGVGNATFTGGVSTAWDARKGNQANIDAVKQYGEHTDALIQEGLESDKKSASYKLAQKYQKQTQGKDGKAGKAMTGFQIRNLVAANEAQFAVEDYDSAVTTAKERLAELGETKDVNKVAKLVAKRVTGQELTRAEKSTLARSQFGAQIAKEMSEPAQQTQSGEKAYNAQYKSITERVGEESRYGVSESGQTTLRTEDEAVTIEEVATVSDGQMTVKLTDGREVYAGDIDFANDSESYLYSAIADMENITPAAATALAKNIDLSSGQSVQEYANGIDEAYTYGYHGYSEADLKAGQYATKLSSEQMMSAYKLGQSARAIGIENQNAQFVQMRTAKDAALSQKEITKQQKAQFASDAEVYFADGSNVVKFDEHNGQYDEKRMAGVNAAKFLSKMGIGSKYYFYESYVNSEGNRVYKDANGNEKPAPNGMYKTSDGSIHIDLNAGDDGQGTTLFTLGHEATHFVKQHSEKQFKALADLVTEAYSKTDMTMHERVVQKQNRLSEIRGEHVSYDEAFEEVVADAMSTMFTDGNLYEKLAELKTKDRGLFNTIKKFFEKLIAKFKKTYEELTPDQKDAQDIRQMKDMFDRIQDAFAKALVEASENFQTSETVLAQAGISVDAKTDAGSIYSVRDVLSEADRNKVAKALAERFGVTEKEAKEWLKAETSLASLILNPKYSMYLDYEGDPNEVAIKQNSDYPQGTVDFSNICKKRREFTQVMNRILRNFPNHVFAATDLAKIRTIMGEEGMTLPCGICYVEDRRQLDTIVAQDFINGLKLYREGSKTRPDGKPFNANQLKGLQLTDGDTYVPSIYELVSLEGRNSLKAKNPNMEAAWVRYNNARGMQAVRLLTNEAEYQRQILKYNKKTVQSKNDHGGLRIYSFSDAEMFHLIDIIQVITDSATVGLSLQGYTKVNEYAKAVKDTGEKLNRSLIPKGDLGYHMENGKVVLDYDTVEGIDIYHEDFFDNKDNPNVGNITIGINDVQIRAAMLSDFVDQIIPFHTGQSEEVLGEKGIAAWDNYKDSQTEKDLSTGRTSSHQVNIYTEVFQAAEAEGKPIQNKRQFVEKFLQVCKENGLQPRFAQFLNTDANGDYIYTEGYHKFLVDFKTFAQTEVGEYLPQMPVKPIFDDAYITGLLEAYVEEQQAKDAEVAKQMPKVIERITNEIVKHGEKHSDRQYMDAVNRGDMETAQRMVDDFARKSGYTEKLYHGTQQFGFTVPDTSKSDDGLSFFATDSIEVARTYSGAENHRQISDEAGDIDSLRDAYNDHVYDFVSLVNSTAGIYNFMDYDDKKLSSFRIKLDVGASDYDTVSDALSDYVDEIVHNLYENALAYDKDLMAEEFFESEEVEKIYEASGVLYDTLKAISEYEEDGAGNYQLYANTEGLFEIDADGNNWNRIPFQSTSGEYLVTTRRLAQYAKAEGYKGVKITNVFDDGGRSVNYQMEPATVYIFFDPQKQVKSADPVTYDESGNVIPLSERFNPENPDIRYSDRDFLADGQLKGNYTVSEISEMFDAWNSDPELTDLSKKVFAKLQEIMDEQEQAYWATPYPIRFKSDAYLQKAYYITPNGIFEPSRTDNNYGITYNLDYFRKTSDQDKARVLLHEAIHACTVGVIKSTERRLPKYADPMEFTPDESWSEQQKAGLELIQTFSQVRVANERDEYGQKNVYEMVAEMSNPEFRAMLKKERLWGRIVDAIKRIFGIEQRTAYDAVSNALEKILELDMQKADGVRHSDRDSSGKQLTKEQQKFFKDSKVRDDKGNLLLVYHGSANEFTVFNGRGNSKFGEYKFMNHIVNYFTTSKDTASDYARKPDYSDGSVYEGYVNITNPYKFKDESVSDRGYSVANGLKNRELREFEISLFEGTLNRLKFADSVEEVNELLLPFNARVKDYGDELGDRYELFSGGGNTLFASENFVTSADDFFDLFADEELLKESILGVNEEYGDDDYYYTTDQVVNLVIAMNNENGTNYDGVIIDNIFDAMTFRGRVAMDVITIKSSNQFKNADNKNPTSNPDIRYSERTGDSVSNRHLLANAFEGISQNSVEYKMIQDYRSHIKELNELETKLHQLNAEIRKIRFGTEGARDADRLRQLEDEAKKVAKEINRYDKRLLNMEASEPLRKVIDRERKKEAQKTKDHVNEIQQSKKVRAEQAELRHKIRKAVRDLDKILNRGNKKLNVKEDMQNVVTKALKAADILFTDNYGNYDMLRNGIGADLSDSEEELVNTCARMLKDIDAIPTDGYDSFMARQEAEKRLSTKMAKLKDVFARERKRLNNTTVSSILGELADAYASLEKSEQSYVQSAYSEAVHNFLKSLQGEVGGTIVKDMTKDQLESIYAAYKMVLTAVRTANKMFNEELKQSREQLGNAVIHEVMNAGGTHGLWTKAEIARSQASWNNMKPIWVANRIGSETFGKLMNGLFKGQYNFAVDVDEAKQFKLSMDEKYHPRNWDAKKLYSFESSTGRKFDLNLQQIMSLYAFSKRGQSYSHLLNGGFVFESNSTVIVDKKGIKRTYLHDGATSYKLNEATLNEIINSLTNEQKAYVDEMQAYLSDVMGAKGNEVSMKLYGIQLFKEKFYFPLRSSGAYMERAKEAEMKKQQGQINLVNSGFTHAVKPEAKNPIILSGFMDVWAEHCNEMSMYHSMVLPMEDFRKVYNYSTVHDDKFDSASVYQTIQDAYGKAATGYIDQLYRELNAGATVDPRETAFKARISKFKKAAVMVSASVVVQQFSAVGRAYALIDPKYFIGTRVKSRTNLSVADEMKKYAPVAIIKEMGGFDTGTKGSAKSYIMAEQYGKGERIKGLKDEQYRSDLMGYFPAKADEITWCSIWEAVKRETRAKYPKMDVTSEQFLTLAGERFSEVIEHTQVYDSVLARSANMRSKGALMSMATAFMAEPTTTINLLEDALRGRSVKKIARAFGAVATSILLNNALASIVYAMRDDDEDETFIEKYFQSFASGMIDDINPMSYYPFLKDVYSLFQGYDVERADMSVIADLRDAAKKAVSLIGKDTSDMEEDELAAHWKQVNEVMMGLLDAGCSALGVPLKNVRRDINGIINAYKTVNADLTERDTTWMSFWDKVGAAVKDTIPVYAWTKDRTKADKLYEAIMAGDKQYVARLKSGYKTDDAYHNAIRKVLRENDPRIHEAALANYNGNSTEYKRIFREIQKEGKFSFDDIMESINSELSSIKSGLQPDTVSSDYSSTDFVNAIIVGDANMAKAMKEDIIDAKVANGDTRAEAEKSFASSVATAARNAFDAGLLDEAGTERMLLEYADMDEEEVAEKVSYWSFIKAHPQYRGRLTEANVEKYHEVAEPAEISLDVFVQYLESTKDLETIRDKWGEEVKSKKEQVLEVIDSLPITRKQKDALYLGAGYAESKIWEVPW